MIMTTLKAKELKIKKAHYCHGCAKKYDEGSVMKYTVTVDRGEFTYAYWCNKCVNKILDMDDWEREDGFAFGELAIEV